MAGASPWGMLPEELYAKYYPLLRYIAEQKFRVPAGDSDDLVQEVFLKFLREPGEKPRPFLVAAVSNACRTYWREQAKLDRDTAMPERRLVPRYERRIAVRRILRKLPPLQRHVLVLRVRGWRIAEIAAQIGRSVSWTEKLLHRARKTAAEELELENRCGEGGGALRTDTYVSCVSCCLIEGGLRCWPITGSCLSSTSIRMAGGRRSGVRGSPYGRR